MRFLFQMRFLPIVLLLGISFTAQSKTLQDFATCQPGVTQVEDVIVQQVCEISEGGSQSINSIEYRKDGTRITLSLLGYVTRSRGFCWYPIGSNAVFRIVDEETGSEIFPIAAQGLDLLCGNDKFLPIPPNTEHIFSLDFPPLPESIARITVKEGTPEGPNETPAAIRGIELKRN